LLVTRTFKLSAMCQPYLPGTVMTIGTFAAEELEGG
jgi:hypothetical protein